MRNLSPLPVEELVAMQDGRGYAGTGGAQRRLPEGAMISIGSVAGEKGTLP